VGGASSEASSQWAEPAKWAEPAVKPAVSGRSQYFHPRNYLTRCKDL